MTDSKAAVETKSSLSFADKVTACLSVQWPRMHALMRTAACLLLEMLGTTRAVLRTIVRSI